MSHDADPIFRVISQHTTDPGELLHACRLQFSFVRVKLQAVPCEADQQIALTVALGLTKRCIHRALESSLVAAMEAEANALELSSRTADFKEGLAAFRDGRRPEFEGR